jgi:hypothetical protein
MATALDIIAKQHKLDLSTHGGLEKATEILVNADSTVLDADPDMARRQREKALRDAKMAEVDEILAKEARAEAEVRAKLAKQNEENVKLAGYLYEEHLVDEMAKVNLSEKPDWLRFRLIRPSTNSSPTCPLAIGHLAASVPASCRHLRVPKAIGQHSNISAGQLAACWRYGLDRACPW